jgi:co-chaperonin GroES (HSP10)
MKIDGCPVVPRRDYVFVADYGKPNRTRGGIFMPTGAAHDYPAYKFDLWRYGEVIAIGPGKRRVNKKGHLIGGRVPMPDIKLGDVVLFSRKHGTRSELRYKHPVLSTDRYAEGSDLEGLLIRVLDPEKIVAVVEDFEPWWDPEECTPVTPSQIMSG